MGRLGGEIILLNRRKWLQINSSIFTVRSFLFSGFEQLSRPPASPTPLLDFELWTYLDHNAATPVLTDQCHNLTARHVQTDAIDHLLLAVADDLVLHPQQPVLA